MGNFGTITNIDTPQNDKELTFALWYDISRQYLLKLLMPNFALSRRIVAALSAVPAGYANSFAYAYEYPSDCLKVLGIGNVEDKQNDYTVESNMILTNTEYADGLPLRFIADVEDVSKFSAEFVKGLSLYLASQACMSVTQDVAKAGQLEVMVSRVIGSISGMNAQENRPIRISNSLYKQSRYTPFPSNSSKK
jgi:hypothetical protein